MGQGEEFPSLTYVDPLVVDVLVVGVAGEDDEEGQREGAGGEEEDEGERVPKVEAEHGSLVAAAGRVGGARVFIDEGMH